MAAVTIFSTGYTSANLYDNMQTIELTGDTVANDGRTMLVFMQNSGDTFTATIASPGTAQGLTLQDVVVAIDQAEPQLVGPFPPAHFNDAFGNLNITYTGAGSNDTAVGAIKIGA